MFGKIYVGNFRTPLYSRDIAVKSRPHQHLATDNMQSAPQYIGPQMTHMAGICVLDTPMCTVALAGATVTNV